MTQPKNARVLIPLEWTSERQEEIVARQSISLFPPKVCYPCVYKSYKYPCQATCYLSPGLCEVMASAVTHFSASHLRLGSICSYSHHPGSVPPKADISISILASGSVS